jgi:hypothetical protein
MKQTCTSAISDATGDFIFLVFPSPKTKGAEWDGGVQQQQQQRKSAATAAAAAARARGNEINTARRLLKIGFAPVDLLYSESLTKSTKSTRRW